jgi:Domain of unknown function (DUF4301)
VPASGAASRMFKALFEFKDAFQHAQADEQLAKNKALTAFFKDLRKFAFYQNLEESMAAKGLNLSQALADKKYDLVLANLLEDSGLGYGNLPKGLLQFHSYESFTRTPAEEHLVEGANYAKDAQGKVLLHFTVSPEHRSRFDELMAKVKNRYEKEYGVSYEIGFSEQKLSTDTIAVGLDNQPFRNKDGSLLFRPAGHGALLENLNELDADIIFVKNIDNVVPDRLKATTYTYKKAIAGLLLDYQQRIFAYLDQLDKGEANDQLLDEIASFLEKELCVKTDQSFASKDLKISYLRGKLNRPIRVCGMVKNEGEPGGGPFWAKNSDGSMSLQIAESAQIDMDNAAQKAIAASATHFNPVDLVCATKDYKGRKFDLLQFRDPMTGFISEKSKDGKTLKALELPGLWNGAMADWNTLFMEVPIETFNPVKTVNDLLRDQHQ